jgi:phospholipid/cholesterol/gamma-HCH transport system permease protein
VNKFVQFDQHDKKLTFHGDWNIENISKIQDEIKTTKISSHVSGDVMFDGKKISKLDSAGVLLIKKELDKLRLKKINVKLHHFSDQNIKLFSLTEKKSVSLKNIPQVKTPEWRAALGKYSIDQGLEFLEYLNFIGRLFFETIRVYYRPDLWRWRSIISTINRTGTQALPIIAILSFMIGVVISYQMGNQLREYGANIFIVDLLGLSILREFGPLLTAIMVAGRTGSAFTAQIGIMKINQEIDALSAMGIELNELLILPRLIGLLIVMPLLTIWADIFGIIGGMMMAQNMLGITWHEFVLRFQQEIPLRSLIIGLAKAPLFAFVISTVSCFQGMKVHGSAESVGTRTTRSVVLAIFFMIVIDAILSVILSKYKL